MIMIYTKIAGQSRGASNTVTNSSSNDPSDGFNRRVLSDF